MPLKPRERDGWTPPRLALDPLALRLRSRYPSRAALTRACGLRPTGGSRSSPTEPGRCTTHDLQVGAGQVQASASIRTLTLELTNVSDHRRTVTGFGGLALLDAGGTQLPTSFHRDDEQPRTIELAPQGFTTRKINWRVVPAQGTSADSNCVSGKALLVTPPDEAPGNLVVDEAITACDSGTITGTPWDREAG